MSSREPAAAEAKDRSTDDGDAGDDTSTESTKSSTRSTPARRRRRWWFPLLALFLAVALPVLMVLAAEGVLRALAVEQPPPLFIEKTDVLGTSWVTANRDYADYYFAAAGAADLSRKPRYQRFYREKKPGTYRVFVLGESAAHGWPLGDNASWARMLETMLGRVVPEDARVEVINCGLTATTASMYASMVEAIAPYEPDLFICYAGHNEFYGVRQPTGLAGWRLARVLGGTGGTGSDDSEQTLMELLGGQRHAPGPEVDGPMQARFTEDLEAIVRAAGSVPVLLCTPPSNERGLSPFGSIVIDAGDWDDVDAAIRAVEAAPNAPTAADHELLRAAAEGAYTKHAGVQHALGLCEQAAGNADAAGAAFQLARNLDTTPFRARDYVRASIEDVAERFGNAHVGDIEAALRAHYSAEAAGGSPGYDLFIDHVHVNLRGSRVVARSVLDALLESPDAFGLTLADDAHATAGTITEADLWHELLIGDIDMYISWYNSILQFGRPPFTDALSTPVTLEHYEAEREQIKRNLDVYEIGQLETWDELPWPKPEIHSMLTRFFDELFLEVDDDTARYELFTKAYLEARRSVAYDPGDAEARFNLALIASYRNEEAYQRTAKKHAAAALFLGVRTEELEKLCESLELPYPN